MKTRLMLEGQRVERLFINFAVKPRRLGRGYKAVTR